MRYVRPTALNHALSLDGQPLDTVALTFDRQNLVDQYNVSVGDPGVVVKAMQKDFVDGNMPYGEMVSYIRYCEYMIHFAQSHGPVAPV